ncbi:MAG TPA: 30S ribosomal protein S6 [Candidatus Paceibacterota bacterium]|uniref:Small ribosomal subunit protein bS6 n=1 Tax=Candidatus Roizmanbacteria bacterium RIFCSPHIGHO2_01_FULL_39_12b TaxID=1802030 RepID=A0A1F7G8C3_9BACT|nr:MAG: hypothetical protein A2690_00030 [Candidatus Roizmanbacteria bacterium RIFCSPHIGHO2_01_FULL_39_12b]
MDETKKYELSLMLKTEEAVESVLLLIKNQDGVVLEKSLIQKAKLTYPIKKETNAFFFSVVLSLLPEKVLALDRELKLLRDVLRFLIITPPIVKEERSERPQRLVKPRPESSQKPEEYREHAVTKEKEPEVLTNELLEKKLEEILG